MDKEEIKNIKKVLWAVVSDYVKKRDSDLQYLKTESYKCRKSTKGVERYGGWCCSCMSWCEDSECNAGHYRSKGSSSAILKYHPQNIHLQCSTCNFADDEKVKRQYGYFMERKFGPEIFKKFNRLNYKLINADLSFYKKLIQLYQEGDEVKIIKYLENCK